jgi:Protein of unknown function (DUF3443)
MTLKKGSKASIGCFLVVMTGLIFLGSCGGSSSSSSSSSSSTPSSPAANNTAPITVGFGILGASGGYVNGAWTSVTVCEPGSTTNCQTIDNVLVDTGSIGLRILNSAFTNFPASSLGAIKDSGGNQLQECIQYADTSYSWGPMMLADVKLAGEKASSIPIQVIGGNSFDVPSACIATPIVAGLPNGGNDDTVAALGANGILGIVGYPWDCGTSCATAGSGDMYYTCPSGNCGYASVDTTVQATNPVAAFSSTDNNGVLITLPSVPAAGAADGTVSGSLIFGIGTQSNNALSSGATIYGVDQYGNIPTAHYNGVQYTSPNNGIYLDTGSNALYVFDANALASAAIVECADASGFYCPGSTISLSPITLSGYNSTTGTVSLSIANADTLFASGNAAFSNLGGDGGTGPSNDTVDFGLPYFLGRSMYVGIMPAVFTGESAPPSAASSATYGYYGF